MTITLALVACATTPKHSVSPTPIASLRTTLASAGIELRLARTAGTSACGPKPPSGDRPCTRCTLVVEADVHRAKLDAIARAFASYPSSALSRARIDHVAVCTEIIGGGDDGRITGIIDRDSRGMFLDITHINDPTVPWYDWIMGEPSAHELVHHELFHLLEYAHAKELMIEDREWDGLNALGFVYHWANNGQGVIPGFLDSYSMTRVAEDKATIYGELMGNPKWMCRKAETDKILRAKIRLVWQRVRTMMGTDSFLRDGAPCAVRYSR